WQAMLEGRSGVGAVTGFDAGGLPVRIAAEVSGFDPAMRFGKRRAKHLDRAAQMALVATAEALEHSKLDVAGWAERVGVVYGTGIGGIRSLEDGWETLRSRGA